MSRLAFLLLLAGWFGVVAARGTPTDAPRAEAGLNQNVHIGGTVILDGSASFDPDGNALTYVWSLAKPAGSAARIAEPDRRITSFVADVPGTYRAVLTVSNGRMGNAAYVTVTALSSRSDLVLHLVYAMDLINYTDRSCFREPAQQNILTRKIGLVLERIDTEDYARALMGLRGVAAKMDGCGGDEAGYADTDDWLDCDAQAEVFPSIETVMEALEDQNH